AIGHRPSQAPSIVHEVLATAGEPLETNVRQALQVRLGHDFSQVRIHANDEAARSARSVDARAYTVGRHIVFGAGQYAPHSSDGLGLLTHELVHVAQQGAADLSAPLSISSPDSPAEREADRSAALATSDSTVQPRSAEVMRDPAPASGAGSVPPTASAPASAPACSLATPAAVDGEKLLFKLDSVDLVPGQEKWLDSLMTEGMLSKEIEVHGYAS